ncbi:MAG TPA: peptidoglycan-binding domain-containing protein [Pyrinomonadaceae bacterium]
MSDEEKGNWKENVDLALKIISGILLPVTIVVAGQLIARQQQRDNDASLQQQRESDLSQRNADRAANLLKSLSSDNVRERQLAVRVVDHLVKENKFPAELGPVLISVSLTDPDPEVARVASEALPQVYKASPELEKTAVAETQRILKNSGYYDGAIDGTNSEKTREALRRFQQENGVEADGTVKANTIQKLRDAQQKRQSQGEQPAQTNTQKPAIPRPGRRGR